MSKDKLKQIENVDVSNSIVQNDFCTKWAYENFIIQQSIKREHVPYRVLEKYFAIVNDKSKDDALLEEMKNITLERALNKFSEPYFKFNGHYYTSIPLFNSTSETTSPPFKKIKTPYNQSDFATDIFNSVTKKIKRTSNTDEIVSYVLSSFTFYSKEHLSKKNQKFINAQYRRNIMITYITVLLGGHFSKVKLKNLDDSSNYDMFQACRNSIKKALIQKD